MGLYDQHYKVLLLVPFLLLMLAFAQIGYQLATTGDFVHRGVDLKGGISLTFVERGLDDRAQLKRDLRAALPEGDVDVRERIQQGGFIVEASDVSIDALLQALESHLGPIKEAEYIVQQTSSSLGASFFRETFTAMGLAFLFMGLAVFITFRKWAPSAAVILAAFSDIVVTLAVFNLTGLKLSKAGIAGFLMLIGYSVDTDIILSTRVLRSRTGTVLERVYSAMKTGFTMNGTTLVAVLVAYFVTQSEIIQQVMIILLIGLLVDMINTWIQNAGILRWYMEGRE